MRKVLCVPWLCVALVLAVCLPAFAQKTCEGEAVPSDPEWYLLKSYGSSSQIADPYAYGGQALQITHPTGSVADDIFVYRHYSAANFSDAPFTPATACATAVVRVKTTGAQAFDSSWSRTLTLVFRSGGNSKSLGLSIRPDAAAVINNSASPSTSYGGVIYGDNTHYVTWTVVAWETGANAALGFNVYRNGVLKSTGTISSGPESRSYDSAHSTLDGVWIGSSQQPRSGAWAFDRIAYKPGQDPTWKPWGTPPGLITGTVRDQSSNALIAGATVSVVGPDGIPVPGGSVTTDGAGSYAVTGLDPAQYKVWISADGYVPRSVSASVTYNGPSAIADARLLPLPAATATVTDMFSREMGFDLGSTEGTPSYPWDDVGEVAGTEAQIDNHALALSIFGWGTPETPEGEVRCHGVSIGQGGVFQPANIDYSLDIGPLQAGSLGAVQGFRPWGGVSYRQAQPGTFSSANGQDPAQAGYLVYCPCDGRNVYLYRNEVLASGTCDIDWSTSHRLRVIAYGNHHVVTIDGVEYISAIDNAKLTGGYVGVLRDDASVVADNIRIAQLPAGGTGADTVAGTVYEAGNPSAKLANAIVVLSDGRMTTTNSTGGYSFSLNSLDNQSVTVYAAGYAPRTVSFDPAFGTTTVNVAMTPDPNYYPTIGAARKAAPGSAVTLFGKPMVAQWNGDAMCIEEPDRSGGIKVVLPATDYALNTKTGINYVVQGTIERDENSGELYIDASSTYELPTSVAPKIFIQPLAMNGRAVTDKTAGLDPTGMDVKVVGRVVAINQPTDFTINDGGGEVKVCIAPSLSGGSDPFVFPQMNDVVSVEGIVSLDGADPVTAVRCIRPWNTNANFIKPKGGNWIAGFESAAHFSDNWWAGVDWWPGGTNATFNFYEYATGSPVYAPTATSDPRTRPDGGNIGTWYCEMTSSTPFNGTGAQVVGTYLAGGDTQPLIWDCEYELSCWARGLNNSSSGLNQLTVWSAYGPTPVVAFPAGTFDWRKFSLRWHWLGTNWRGIHPDFLAWEICCWDTCTAIDFDDFFLGYARGTVKQIDPVRY